MKGVVCQNDVQVQPNDFNFDSLRERLSNVLKENVNACVKINGRLEITRPVALAMLNQLSRSIASLGGSVSIKKEVLSFSPVVVKAICELSLPNGSILQFEALGSAEEGDITGEKRVYHDTLGTAETRATKRLLEEVVGEDFINKILVPIMEKMGNGNGKKSNGDKPATQKQKDLIQKLIYEGKIKDKIDLDKLTMAQASQLLDKVFKK